MLRLVSEKTGFLCIIKAIRFFLPLSTGWLLLFFIVHWTIPLLSLFSFLFTYSFLFFLFLKESFYVAGGPYLPFLDYEVNRSVFGGLASLFLIFFGSVFFSFVDFIITAVPRYVNIFFDSFFILFLFTFFCLSKMLYSENYNNSFPRSASQADMLTCPFSNALCRRHAVSTDRNEGQTCRGVFDSTAQLWHTAIENPESSFRLQASGTIMNPASGKTERRKLQPLPTVRERSNGTVFQAHRSKKTRDRNIHSGSLAFLFYLSFSKIIAVFFFQVYSFTVLPEERFRSFPSAVPYPSVPAASARYPPVFRPLSECRKDLHLPG